MTTARYCGWGTWVFLRVLRKLGVINAISFTVKARVLGHSVRVPIDHGIGENMLYVGEPWAHGVYPLLLRAFPGTFVDVGVNLGQTLTRVRILDAERPYVGFEPNPRCVAYAQRLADLNGFRNAPIVPAGLSTDDGAAELTMNTPDAGDEGATLVRDFRPGHTVHRRLPVRLVRFATAEQELGIGPLGIVKIDVEGSEREVLRSLEQRLTADRPAILLEILPVGRPENVDRLGRQQDIEALFQQLRYRLFRIHNKPGHMRLEAMEVPIGVHNDQDLANFIVLPVERCEEELLASLRTGVQQ